MADSAPAIVVSVNSEGFLSMGVAGDNEPLIRERCEIAAAADAATAEDDWGSKVSVALTRILDSEKHKGAWTEIGGSFAGRHVVLADSFEHEVVSEKAREQWTKLFFENFEVGSFYAMPRACAALYSAGKTTGVIVEFSVYEGDTPQLRIQSIAVYEGYCIRHSVRAKTVSVTGSLASLLNDGSHDHDIKKLREDLLSELGTCIKESINPSCDCDIWQDLCGNILLWGSKSKDLERVSELLQSPIVQTPSPEQFDGQNSDDTPLRRAFADFKQALAWKISLSVPPCGEDAGWHGAAIFAALDPGTGMWIRKEEYQAEGAAVVHRKCPL